MMRRSVSETQIGATQRRFRVRIEDDASQPGWQAEARLHEFMMQLAQQPDLLNCGYRKPQKLNFFHGGQCWIAEGEAVVETETE